MLGFVDFRVAEAVADIFSEVLPNDGTKDIVYQPLETAKEERINQTPDFDNPDQDYLLPFIRLWRTDFNLSKETYNHKMADQGLHLYWQGNVNSGTEINIYPAVMKYDISYFDERNKQRKDRYEFIHMKRTRSAHVFDMEIPFLDSNRDETGSPISWKQQYMLSEMTDNSSIERQYEEGIFYRIDSELEVRAYVFESKSDYPTIEKVIVNWLVDEEGADPVLVEQTIVQ